MNNIDYNEKYDVCDKKELLLKILNSEKERQNEINKLNRELRIAEEHGDTDKIDEIIDRLNIIDPISGKSEKFEYLGYLEYLDEQKTMKKIFRNKNGRIFKISAACIAIFVGLQIVFSSAFNINILGGIYNSMSDTVSSLMNNKQTDNANITDSADNSSSLDGSDVLENEDYGIRQYDTIAEFEQAEKINLFGSSYVLPDDMKVKTVIYYYDYGINQVNILFDDNTSMSVKLSTDSIRNGNCNMPENAD
ncbi:MAG: hypothetical protein FWD71_15290 [Oscillospiraceae bacterium]|nr:hypothetical protein [Oscillospiraceae bacterium]